MKIKKCTYCKKSLPICAFEDEYEKRKLYQRCKKCREYLRKWAGPFKTKNLKRIRAYRHTPAGYFMNFKYWNKNRTPVDITKDEFISWNKQQKRECFYCSMPESVFIELYNTPAKKHNRLTIDRKDTSLPYQLNNIVLACRPCNTSKSNLFSAKVFREIAQKYLKPLWVKQINDKKNN